MLRPSPSPWGPPCRWVRAADANTHAEHMNTGHAHGTRYTTPSPPRQGLSDWGAISGHLSEKGVSWGIGDPN